MVAGRGAAVTSGGSQGEAPGLPVPGDVLRGFSLFNRGEFYRCHEYLEDAWRAEPGPVRHLYQGVLQVGVGFYHLRRGNRRGARSLILKGLARLRPFEPETLGIDVFRLVREVEEHLEGIERGEPEIPDEFPKIRAPNGAAVP